MIRHISFDLWMTLLRSHPDLKSERAMFFAKNYNPCGLSLIEVQGIIRDVDAMVTSTNELSGRNTSPEALYSFILHRLGNDLHAVSHAEISAIKQFGRELFERFPPRLFDEKTSATLNELCERGMTMNIACNTGFVEGDQLRAALAELGVAEYFQFFVFSNELDASKPSPVFFQKIWDCARQTHPSEGDVFQKKSVLHVGDNPRADAAGAEVFGFQSLTINSNGTDIAETLRLF